MYKERLHGLADGIFAIVMTLLVLDLRVPELFGVVTDAELWREIERLLPAFLSYVLAFLILASYWMAHNYIVTIFAKNVTRTLAYLNIPFFMAVGLIPFSARLLGDYYYTQTAVVIFAVNVMVIGIVLALLIKYVFDSDAIENIQLLSRGDKILGYVRSLVPVVSAIITIALTYYSVSAAVYFFVAVTILNFFPGVMRALVKLSGASGESRFQRVR